MANRPVSLNPGVQYRTLPTFSTSSPLGQLAVNFMTRYTSRPRNYTSSMVLTVIEVGIRTERFFLVNQPNRSGPGPTKVSIFRFYT